jgi:hypothetical protein
MKQSDLGKSLDPKLWNNVKKALENTDSPWSHLVENPEAVLGQIFVHIVVKVAHMLDQIV